jgi:hypothetical protein
MASGIQQGNNLEFFGYHIAYFDTNVYGLLVERPDSWAVIRTLLTDRNLLLGVSDTNVLELSDAPRLHQGLARFLLQVPSALLKPTNSIIDEEVEAYLADTAVNPVYGPVASLILEMDDPVQFLLDELFQDEGICGLRASMVDWKPEFESRIRDRHQNFQPLVCPDRYTEADAPYYAYALIFLQVLCSEYPECARTVKQEMGAMSDKSPAILSRMRGLWLSSLVQFYRYYLHRREPGGTDYGDLLQVLPIAYCCLAVVENDLSNQLKHIKRHDSVLNQCEIWNLETLREATGLSVGR